MRLFILINIILCPLFASGQSYFNNSYDLNGGVNFTTSAIESNSGYYFVSCSRIDTIPSINIIHIDYTGGVVFEKRYFFNNYIFNMGASHCLTITVDNNFVFSGQIRDTLLNTDCFVMKFDMNGDTIWTKRFGGSGFDSGNAIFANADTSCTVICNTNSFGQGGTDFLRMHLDQDGNFLDSSLYGTSASESAYNGDKTSDGGMIISGMRNSSPYIVKTDNSGVEEWNYSYPYANDYCFISQLISGDYIIASRKITSTDGSQICLIKINNTGSVVWQRLYGTSADEYSYSKPVILNDGSIVVGGEFVPVSGVAGGFVLKTDSLGNQKWLRYYTLSTLSNDFYDIKSTSDGGFILAGSTYITTQDAWVVKIDSMGCEVAGCDGVGFIEPPDKVSLKLFPNPSIDGAATISWPTSLGAQTLSLFDATGKKIREEKLSVGQSTFQLTENLSAGLYLVRLEYAGGVLTEKFIVR